MKVGILHPYFDVIGGAEMTSTSLINALIQEKINTKLYCVKPPDISETEIFQIIQVKQKKFPLFWKYQRMLEIKKLFKMIKNEDILFVMSGGLTLEESTIKKTYIYCHSTFDSEIDFVNKKTSSPKSFYLGMIQKNIQNSLNALKNESTRLIANSYFTKEKIMKNFGKDAIVIYPPVRIEKLKEFQNNKKQNKVITISRFSAEKNLDSTINTLNKTSLYCEIIGNAKYKNQFKVLDELRVKKSENIRIYSNISHDQVLELLSTAKVYLHTSPETFGISVVEAIAAGCIPIVPDNSAHKETVPFSELRFTDEIQAIEMIKNGVNGKLDYLLPKLQQHALQFSEKNFQYKMLELIT